MFDEAEWTNNNDKYIVLSRCGWCFVGVELKVVYKYIQVQRRTYLFMIEITGL